MRAARRHKLTAALSAHVANITAELRDKIRTPGALRQRAKQLHADEQLDDDFDVWSDLLARRAAVLWVLKSVYVRVLEDRGLLARARVLDPEAQQQFERLTPKLGETAFLRSVYRDLASAEGGLPELFGPQPTELTWPSDRLSRELLAFWRHRDPDTGARWSFADETFGGELMGDLYQQLDPVVKHRFALCQTPDFVRAFMLDRTLTPAIEAFGADQVRLLDPACGSGHFLIDGLERLAAATAKQHPEWGKRQLVEHCLARVVGVDINAYACALARARLLMTAAELANVVSLGAASQFHPQVYWADGLEQIERDDQLPRVQPDLFNQVQVKPRPHARASLKKLFEAGFHAVVANPPYITEKHEARKAYHREKLGKQRRYVSAYREYSLGSPFTERCFQLAKKQGFVGIITSNNFMKREFGRPLIELVLVGIDLELVVDTSLAYIPFHGTPTVLLFGRNRRKQGKSIRAVMGKRGESGTPAEPALGHVWASIVEGWDHVGFENEYISVAELPRDTLAKHPWSLGGGGAAALKEVLDQRAPHTLGDFAQSVGFMCITKQDEVFVQDEQLLARLGCEPAWTRRFVLGDMVRDWGVAQGPSALFPYDRSTELMLLESAPAASRYLWRFRRVLEARAVFGGQTFRSKGRSWWAYGQIPKGRFHTPLSIAFAFVATHNHFVLDRGGKVFNRSAPVIKLAPDASEDDHLALLGLLNSSTACFWMKQVFHAKAAGGIGRGLEPEPFMERYEFDGTKIKRFPVIAGSPRVTAYARRLDLLARARAARAISGILGRRDSWSNASELSDTLQARRRADLLDLQLMVAVQEELDWLCYALYGLDESSDVVDPEQLEPLLPTWLPWCVTFAVRDAANRAALAQDEASHDLPSVWFERHGWKPQTELPGTLSPATRARIEARRKRTASSPALTLIESANFKRRWYKPNDEAQERQALALWLAEQVEHAIKGRERPVTLSQITAALQDDSRVLAVCEVLTGRPDFSLASLIADTLAADAVPNHRFHVYKPSGLIKRDAWERTWAAQRREDAGEAVDPALPPKYGIGDFLRPGFWQLRGKLDVPKERFIAFTEVPGHSGDAALFGWAGWTPLERARAMLAIDEQLEQAGVTIADRIALLDSAWRLLPDIARDDAVLAGQLEAELRALVGHQGPGKEMLTDWATRFPPPGARSRRKPKTKTKGRAGKQAPARPASS